MKYRLLKRIIALLLILASLLSAMPFSVFAEEEPILADPITRASQGVTQKASTLKAKINSLPTAGSLKNVRVDLTGFAPTTAEGDPILGLRGQYYVAYLQDETAKILDGSWGDAISKAGPLPSVSVSVVGNSLDVDGIDRDVSFTLLPAEIFNNLGIGRHVFAFANKTLTGTVAEVYQLALGSNQVATYDADSIASSPRILCKRVEGSNAMELLYSDSNGTVYALRTITAGDEPTFGWVKGNTGPEYVLYRIWSTVKLRTAIGNVASLLNNPDNYIASEYENFLACLEKSITAFQTYNSDPTGLIAPEVYPQEEMDRLAEELESYRTLLDKSMAYIDIPVEIIDFRSDGYLFENTANYAFRFDYRDVDEADLGEALQKNILDRFGNLPELPGELATPLSSESGASNMRIGLTEQSLVNGNLVYKQGTVEYMAHSLCKKTSVTTASLARHVPGNPQTLEEFIQETFYKPYTNANATEEQKAAILGTWEQTMEKIGGENGNPMTWSQVETAMDAAYYLLTYLWRPVADNDTFYYSGSAASPDTSVVDQDNNRYNMVVRERDTLRLYGSSKNGYVLDSTSSSKEMGYSGRYIFNTSGKSNVIKVSKPGFAPIDGLGFETPGIMTNNYDTDPGSGRVVVEGHNGYDSNYNFSMHAYGSFVYYEDQNLYFYFKGDDDVYFFINGDMALDIGSSHAAKTGTCYLNQFTDQKGNHLVNGQVYTFDMFYTERATPDANFSFKTNIKMFDDRAMTTKGQYLEIHGSENRVDSNTGMGVPLEENAMVAIGDTIAYSFELLNTRTVPLFNVSFTDATLGVEISKDHLKLCDSTNNYALNNGAKTKISDIVVTYRTCNDANSIEDGELTMVPYSTMLPWIQEATTEPTGTNTQFKQLASGSYGVRISSEMELKTLLELGIPVNCQMAVYGFKRTMIKEDQPYQNTVQSLAYYKRVSVDGSGLVYGAPIAVTGAADRTLRVPDLESLSIPSVDPERYVIDYSKPVEISIEDLTKHIYSTKYVPVGNLIGFISDGSNGSILRRAPEILYCEKATGGKTLETSRGTVTRKNNTLTYSLNGFLSEIDRFYAVVEISGLVLKTSNSTYDYPYILVEIQIIPATTMYYETDIASQEFTYETPEISVGEHLYFDFTDNSVDRERYNSNLYGNGKFYNYDTADAWRHRSKTMIPTTLDPETDNLVLTTLDKTTLDNNGNNFYVQASPNIASNLNMNYHPKEGDVMKIRFRMSNIALAGTNTQYSINFALFDVHNPATNNSNLFPLNDHTFTYDQKEEYKELTVKLWSNKSSNYRKDLLTAFRITFKRMTIADTAKGPGVVEIDYIYIGTEKDFAQMDRLYKHTWQSETDGTDHEDEVQESDFVNQTVYDLEKCDDSKRFFLDFKNTQEDRDRYSTATYKNVNWDDINEWTTHGGVVNHAMDNDLGLYALTAKASLGETEFPSIHRDMTGLAFVPTDAEVYQVRFKLTNFELGEYKTSGGEISSFDMPYVDLHYKYDSTTGFSKIAGENWLKYYDAKYLTNGEYVTMTLDLTDTFRNASKIHYLRFYFGGMESPADGTNGILTIDYIYIGPRDRAPADTVYGYDPSYDNDLKLSNGSSIYVEGSGVRVNGTETDYTETLFSFTGTGFDIISRTGSEQGTIRVSVFSDVERTKLVKALTVNNKGELELYQIPVVSIQDLPHGTYYVTVGVNKKITGSVFEMLNRGDQFYFDAIRIYDPMDATTDTELQKVYRMDLEVDPRIKEVRNILLSSDEFASLMGSAEGAVFIDSYQKENVTVPNPETGKPETVDDPNISINEHYALTVQTYNKVGPKNEVYLSPGQAVAFLLKIHSKATPVSFDIGAKTVNGTSAELVAGVVTASEDMDSVLAIETATRKVLNTATAMYYPLEINTDMIPKDRYCYIVIMNGSDEPDPRNGDCVLSVTDIKVCYSSVLSQNLPEDDFHDPEIVKRRAEELISFEVDENTAKAAAFFLNEELSLPLEIGDTKIYHSLSLTDSIVLNYAVAKKDLAGCEDVYMEVKLPMYTENTLTGTRTITLNPVEKGDFYYFVLADLNAVTMNDRPEAILYYTAEGTAYRTEKDTYSVAEYAYGQLRKESASTALKNLCADLLRYGAYAQSYKGYRTDALVDSELKESYSSYLSDMETVSFGNTNHVLMDVENAPVVWVGKSLNLESKVELRFIFDVKNYHGDLKDLTMKVMYTDVKGNAETVTIEALEVYNSNYGFYAFTLDTLAAAELRCVVSAQIYAGDTPVSCTLQYAADTYGNGKTGVLGDLCKALFAYSDSARDYFAN